MANAATTVTLRVRRECNRLYFSLKPEGGDWVFAGTDVVPAAWPQDVAWVGLILKTYGGGATVTADFNYFDIIQSDDCVPVAREVFRRGDYNLDGGRDIGDAISILGYLFGGDPAGSCPDAGDCNDDGDLNIADAIALLGHLFASEGPLPDPFELCGPDPTPDVLDPCTFPPDMCP